ncbi:hypothetical protein A2415_04520 [candidate division WWE3 bacterium RIFOXYC1_FULL_39_7]|uniref:Uncharacterized protein n=1 Tax=candidate division WWE3 bacterium RIFOXYC1_FULL_39_7 TaxID=1802643 RepID=A0A1F4WFY5_UNCKA|nr:MAG: hypothetical protein A2415_04520 [candidate division WWE3 bacterium RIFOXYC1_FULL_39_7]
MVALKLRLEQKEVLDKLSLAVKKDKLNLKCSSQACEYMKPLTHWTNQEWSDFVTWWLDNKAIVAGGHILEYLQQKQAKGD